MARKRSRLKEEELGQPSTIGGRLKLTVRRVGWWKVDGDGKRERVWSEYEGGVRAERASERGERRKVVFK